MNKTMMILLVLSAVFLTACATSDAPSQPSAAPNSAGSVGETTEQVLTGCDAIPTLNATWATKKQILEKEQKELLMETAALQQRLQKFKVLKLDREVKDLEKELGTLNTQCN